MKLLTGFLIFIYCFTTPAYPAGLDDLLWTTSGGQVTITSSNPRAEGELIIPDTIDGDPVTKINSSAFRARNLTTITIPDSVTVIGNEAFKDCTSLTDVTIGNSVTSIGKSAFYGCTSLTGITIPDSVTSIGKSAFGNCTSLTGITIPDSVTSIGENAFGNCTSLTSITIPDSVTSIGGYTFYGCTSLTGITIPDSVTSIGDSAFTGCTSLTRIANSKNVTSIGEYAFTGCRDLWAFTMPSGVTNIGEYAFSGCSSLRNIDIPYGVTSILRGAFQGCNLSEIIIPSNITSIGSEAFNGVPAKKIVIGENVTAIGNSAFKYNSSYEVIFLGPKPTTITTTGRYPSFRSQESVFVTDQHAASYGGFGSSFFGTVLNVAEHLDDDTPPTVSIDSTINTLGREETAAITFSLSEPSNNFTQSTVTVAGGILSKFEGAGNTYTAIFVPTSNSTADGVIIIESDKFSDFSGNRNSDGLDENNRLTLSVDTTDEENPAIEILQNEIVSLNNELGLLASERDTLQSEKSQLTTQLTSLEETIAAKEASIVELSQRPTQTAYDDVVTERDARPTAEQLTTVEAQLTQEKVKRIEAEEQRDAATADLVSLYSDFRGAKEERDILRIEKATFAETLATKDTTITELSQRPTQESYDAIVAQRDARPTQESYDAIVAQRDARPTQESYDAIVAQRDVRFTRSEIQDAKLGSVVLLPNLVNGQEQIVKLRFCIQESNDLGVWSTRKEEAEVNIPLLPGKKFLRFSVKEDQ